MQDGVKMEAALQDEGEIVGEEGWPTVDFGEKTSLFFFFQFKPPNVLVLYFVPQKMYNMVG